jgi:hypothetical protein
MVSDEDARAALYYPDWNVADATFLFESLLYWDRLVCIVPKEGMRPGELYGGWSGTEGDRELDRILHDLNETFVTGIAPTEEQKLKVHERLAFLAEREPPGWCRPHNLAPEHQTVFSAWKLAPMTVELLREAGWIQPAPGTTEG